MSEIPPAGTPVDQRLYNEACRRVMALDHRVAELEDELRVVSAAYSALLAAQEYDGASKTHQEF